MPAEWKLMSEDEPPVKPYSWAYEVLEVSPDATWPEIQAAYLRIEERWERWSPDHPEYAEQLHDVIQSAILALGKRLNKFKR
jgi:hypothetical protein